jgi:ferrous iron transport protein B
VKYSKDYDKEAARISGYYQERIAGENNIEAGPIENEKEEAINKLNLEKRSEEQSGSYMGMIGHAIEPAVKPLGFDWRLGVSILSGVAAKEVVVSTMAILYHADNDDGGSSLVEKIQQHKDPSGKPFFTPLIAFSFMLFILTYFPCVGVVSAISRESGSWKWAAFVVVYTTSVAWLLSFSVYQIGSLFI